MSINYTEIASTAISFIVYSFIGIASLSFLCGLYGILLTILKFLCIGRKRFFNRVARPTPPAKALDPIYGTHGMLKLKSSGISIHYVSKGVPLQPMILFIHGFPECWYSWRYQMKYFSKDYRVVAIDQRGYGLSTKAPFVYDYRVEALAGDIADVIEQLGYESCIIVGHDIGGLIAWTTAMLYPHLVEKLVVLNSPHPVALRQELSLSQILRSWHMFFSLTPLVPELLLQSDDFSLFKNAYHKGSSSLVNKNNITDEDIDVYKYTFSQPGTVRASLNTFRAFFRFQADFSRSEVSAPVLMLWGCHDPTLDESLADASVKYGGDIRLKKLNNTSRWINQDVPEVVNKYIEHFLNEKAPVEAHYDI